MEGKTKIQTVKMPPVPSAEGCNLGREIGACDLES
jgi:hypothetical protein